MYTAYFNNIKAHFGNRLRAPINKLCEKKEKAENLNQEMLKRGFDKKVIQAAIRRQVYIPCNQVKEPIAKKEIPTTVLLGDGARAQVRDFLSTYVTGYRFGKESIFYDVAAKPENHWKAFYKIAELSEVNQMNAFACFPTRTTFIPGYMTIDSKILNHHIIKSSKTLKANQKFDVWEKVVFLKRKAFQEQGHMKSLRFQGTLETDRVGVSILKQNTETSRKVPKTKKAIQVDDEATKHIENLDQAVLKDLVGRCVLIDSGRRDVMYCMKETSTVEEKQKFIFTKNCRNKCSRRFKVLRKRNMPSVVKKAEAILSNCQSKSVDPEKFMNYTKARSSVQNTLYEYYGNETIKSPKTFYPGSDFNIHTDQKGNLYYGSLFVAQIRGFYPQPKYENESDDNYAKYAISLNVLFSIILLSFRVFSL